MLLTIDVGNTNIGFGLFDGRELVHQFRCESARQRTADEYAVLLRQMVAMRTVEVRDINAAIIASVVPALTDVLVETVRRAFAREPMVVGPGIRTGMPILYENPREVGADRIVNAVAAYEDVRDALIIVDFGTATTFDCVSQKGEYVGGVIAPGIQISVDALVARAAKLPRIEIALPPRVIGRNPMHSMQSGIVYGYAGLVDGIVQRIQAELGACREVLATGGLAPLIVPHTKTIHRIDDSITYRGLRLIYERNAEP